jgi:hypothetical protein
MISLLTQPDLSFSGFKVAVIGLDSAMQRKITSLLDLAVTDTNIVIYDLSPEANSVEYVLTVLETSDLIVFNAPNLFHWLTGYILSLPHCYYIEFDGNNVNTLYKLSLRQVDNDGIELLVNNAIQKKYGKTL